MIPSPAQRRGRSWLAAVGILICSLALELWSPPTTVDQLFFDACVWINATSGKKLQQSVVAAFDNDALRGLGYPIDRRMYAKVLKRIQKLRPNLVAFDVIFGESKDAEGTAMLAKELSTSPSVILAAIRDKAGAIDGPVAPILSSARLAALTDFRVDDDGRLRWYPLMLETSSGFVPSLAFAMYLKATDQTAELISSGGINGAGEIAAVDVVSSSHKKRRIDLGADPLRLGRIPLVPRAMSAQIGSMSWIDLMGDNVRLPSVVGAGPAVIIGAIADGVSSHQATALDSMQAPIHNHLFAFEDLMQDHWLRGLPIWARLLMICLAALLFCRPSTGKPKTLLEVAATGLSVPVLMITAMVALWHFGYLWQPTVAFALSFTSVGIGSIRRLDAEHKRKQALIRSFGNYLHPAIIERMLQEGPEVVLEGQRKEITIVFCDLRNFTSLSEKLSPENLVTVLNQYFKVVAHHVQDHDGTVDKFIGDAVMAFWNAPVECPEHRLRAASAVKNIIRDFEILSREWVSVYGLNEPVRIGIGIHTGESVVGNVGGANRFNYTALGNNVNLASRLEGVCKLFAVDIVASSEFLGEMADESDWLALDVIQVKGQTRSVKIFTFLPQPMLWRRQWELFRKSWQDGNFTLARERLSEIPDEFGPKAEFSNRLSSMVDKPTGWDGVWKLKSK